MTLQARPFDDSDMPRLQAELAGWIRAAGACGYGHIGYLPHRIYGTLRRRQALGELVQVWEEGGRLAGVTICGLFGSAFDAMVAPDLRGGAAELAILAAAADTTRRLIGAGQAEVITDVHSCDSTRRALLGQLGFAEYRQWDDLNARDLAGPIPAGPAPAGFVVRPAGPGDAAQLAAAHASAFGEGWSTEEYRDLVMARPGYRAEREIVAVARDRRVAAFAVFWADELNQSGLFEPVGTAGDFRRRGLARAAMAHAMGEMRRLGLRTAMVAHDATNLPARAIYAGLGFRKVGETLGYRRPAT